MSFGDNLVMNSKDVAWYMPTLKSHTTINDIVLLFPYLGCIKYRLKSHTIQALQSISTAMVYSACTEIDLFPLNCVQLVLLTVSKITLELQ